MIAVIRLRGKIGTRKEVGDTLRMLGLTHVNTMAIVPESFSGMIKKVGDFVTWGELDNEMIELFSNQKVVRLKPPKKGFKSLKRPYPKGDLGYRGKAINDLIRRII